jgi:hypothetical protein
MNRFLFVYGSLSTPRKVEMNRSSWFRRTAFRAFHGVAACALLALAAPLNAAVLPVWGSVETTAPDSTQGADFGSAVAITMGLAVVGAPGAAVGANGGQGKVYVYTGGNGSWTLSTTLTAADGAAGEAFGTAVASDGQRIAIASRRAVYIFTDDNGSWQPEAELQPAQVPGSAPALALQGNHLLIGIGSANTAYAYTASGGNWMPTQTLTAPDPPAGGNTFGSALTLDGDQALIGAPGGSVGVVYAYALDAGSGTWQPTQTFHSGDAAQNDGFGGALSLDAGTALVGAPGATSSGAAYVFTSLSSGPWQQSARILPSETGLTDFGQAVALSGNLALIGAPGAQSSAEIFLFDNDKWTPDASFPAGSTVASSFGSVVALAGSDAVIGAPDRTIDAFTDAGSVFFAVGSQPGGSAPVAADGTLTTTRNTAASGNLDAGDPSDLPLQFRVVTPPAHGSVRIYDPANGGYTYTPSSNYVGDDRFTFRAGNGEQNSNTATVRVTVQDGGPTIPVLGAAGTGSAGGSPGLPSLGLLTLLAFLRRRERSR